MKVENRMLALETRKKMPLIYHYVNITRPYATFSVQVKVDDVATTRMVLLMRHEKLPTLTACDFMKKLVNVNNTDGMFTSTFSQ